MRREEKPDETLKSLVRWQLHARPRSGCIRPGGQKRLCLRGCERNHNPSVWRLSLWLPGTLLRRVQKKKGGKTMRSTLAVSNVTGRCVMGATGKASWWISLSVALVVGFGMEAAPAHAGKNCGDLLGLKLYSCTATDGVTPSSGFLAFGAGASALQGVNGVFESFTFGPCYCGAKGTLDDPQIGASPAFTCLDNNTVTFLMGTTTGKKIKQGTLFNSGSSWFFDCTELEL